jgi:DNA-directed RNA polymerase subunit omega
MVFPLEQLIKYTGNIYEITCASNRRAYQLSMVHDELIERNDGKVVPVAAKQLFDNDVQYRIEP